MGCCVFVDQMSIRSGLVIKPDQSNATLRDHLRSRTRHAHDILDKAMSSECWTTPVGYARFLNAQYIARISFERWAERACPADLRPPLQSRLLQADMRELMVKETVPSQEFALPDSASALGAVWALAGSSLGNAVILRSLSAEPTCAHLPTRFLSDNSMHEFWKALLPNLNQAYRPQSVEAACNGALAVFSHFLDCVRSLDQRIAA